MLVKGWALRGGFLGPSVGFELAGERVSHVKGPVIVSGFKGKKAFSTVLLFLGKTKKCLITPEGHRTKEKIPPKSDEEQDRTEIGY